MANDEKKQDLRSGVPRRLGDWLHMAMIACYMAVLFVQPAAAADDDMWTRFSEIIANVYGELLGISTIVAVTAAAVALLVRMISRNERAVAEATSDMDRAEHPGIHCCLPAAAHRRRQVHTPQTVISSSATSKRLRRTCQ